MSKAEYWQDIIKCQKKSKQDVESWCKENKVAVSSYYKWKKKLDSCEDTMEPFLPVVMDTTVNQNITLEVNGIIIRFDKELLPTIIQSIK